MWELGQKERERNKKPAGSGKKRGPFLGQVGGRNPQKMSYCPSLGSFFKMPVDLIRKTRWKWEKKDSACSSFFATQSLRKLGSRNRARQFPKIIDGFFLLERGGGKGGRSIRVEGTFFPSPIILFLAPLSQLPDEVTRLTNQHLKQESSKKKSCGGQSWRRSMNGIMIVILSFRPWDF